MMLYLSNPGMNWLAACQQLEQQGQAYCIATVLAYVDQCRDPVARRWLSLAQGQFDALGGGNLEYQVIAKARENLALQHAEPIIERFALTGRILDNAVAERCK
ncbi:hypothetical protein P4S64_18045 [Vibrio sp. M60_M31a]